MSEFVLLLVSLNYLGKYCFFQLTVSDQRDHVCINNLAYLICVFYSLCTNIFTIVYATDVKPMGCLHLFLYVRRNK